MLQNIRSYSDFYSSQRKEVLLDKQRVWWINSQDNYSFNVGYAFWGNNLRFFLWTLKTEVFRDSEHVTPCSWRVEDTAFGVTNPRPAAVFQPHFTEPGQGLVFTSGNFQNREDSRHHSSRADRGQHDRHYRNKECSGPNSFRADGGRHWDGIHLLCATFHHLSEEWNAIQVDELLSKGNIPGEAGQILQGFQLGIHTWWLYSFMELLGILSLGKERREQKEDKYMLSICPSLKNEYSSTKLNESLGNKYA